MRAESLLLKTVLFNIFHVCVSYNSTVGKITKEECDKISGMEVRYNEFYELYLGHKNDDNNTLEEEGIIYQSLTKAVDACCPGMTINFTHVNETIEHLVQEDILHHHDVQNSSHLVFYFPEFTAQGKLEIYSHQVPFLKLRKSPGFALVMLKSESHLDISALDIIQPSWSIFALMLSLSWAVGIIAWALDHRSNPDEFPKPFVRGMFEGFWWAMVTMSTVGYGDKAPKSIFARILGVIWILAGAILMSLFTANTTSIITAGRIEKNAQTMGKTIGAVNMKEFVEAELNLGAHIKEFRKVEEALKALKNKSIDRLLFPHYLDLLFLMSDPSISTPHFSEIYIAKEVDKSFQIGMVLSHGDSQSVQNNDFYTCLEIMTSRISAKTQYDYSRIDESIIDEAKNTFDTEVTLLYLYAILGLIGLMILVGAAFDIYNLYYKPRKTHKNSAEYEDNRSKPV